MSEEELSFDVSRPAGQVIALPLGNAELRVIWCPPGTFQMGSDEEGISGAPLHEVALTSGFWMLATAVLQRHWEAAIGTRYRDSGNRTDRFPVESVTWDRAIEFCRALTERLRHDETIDRNTFCSLPTEAQWEYACRAGTTTPWYFGSSEAELPSHAWMDANSNGELHEAAQKQPNPWGLYDVYGNVAEWCLDDLATYRSAVDPIGKLDEELKILRGGSYADGQVLCRSAARASLIRTNPFSEETGLRIVLNPAHSWRDRGDVISGLLS